MPSIAATQSGLSASIHRSAGAGRHSGKGTVMRYLTQIEQRGSMVHVEIFECNGADSKTVALFACLAGSASTGLIHELVRLGEEGALLGSGGAALRGP